MRTSMTSHRLIVGLLGVLTAVVLAACGEDGNSDSLTATEHGDTSSTGEQIHNEADVAFATGMIPHHLQAVEMAALAADRASDPQVADLAARIQQTQQPEIDTMTGWLESWGEPVPGEDSTGGHDGHDMPSGMMSDDQMTRLESASGAEFDRMFLEMMIEHHRGAIEMAETEQAEGSYSPAIEMAGEIAATQAEEITQMQEILGQ